MKTAYFDASAIVKLLVHEPESMALLDYLEAPTEAATSRISLVEVVRAVRRYSLEHSRDAEAVLQAFALLDVTSDICREAGTLAPCGLRSLDAFHLATALSIDDPDLEFITYDAGLAQAAGANRLRVVQPGLQHPRLPPRL